MPPDMRYENMVLFAQGGCKMTEDDLVSKRLWGLAVAMLGTFIVLFLRIKLGFIKKLDEINEKIYDQKLITIEDYTVKFTITQTMFEKFRKAHEFLVEVEGYNLNLGFEKDIQKSIEEQVCRKIGLSEDVSKIANIQLGFDSGGMLRLLESRATALKKANFVKVRDINDKMT